MDAHGGYRGTMLHELVTHEAWYLDNQSQPAHDVGKTLQQNVLKFLAAAEVAKTVVMDCALRFSREHKNVNFAAGDV